TGGTGKQGEGRRLISSTRAGEDVRPLHLGAAEDRRHELTHAIGRRIQPRLSWRWLSVLAIAAQSGYDLGSADQIVWVDAQCPAHEAQQENRADTYAAPTTDGRAARTLAAAVLYPVAARQCIDAHCLTHTLVAGGIPAAARTLPP